jgi:DNA-binding response OmpR family regulator
LIPKILLIEDDVDLLELFSDALLQNGYSVDKFADPIKAVSAFEQNPNGYDLILSDIRMPEISGLELARRIKEINSDVNFALMSAFETNDFQSELKELGLSTFMKKPMHIDQIISAVKGCLGDSKKVGRIK